MSSSNVYVKNKKKRKRGKKERINQYRNDLKVLREHDTVDAAGPISKIKNKSIEILSNEILVKFKPKVSVANINRLVNDCGLKISYLNLDGEYVIEARQDCEYNLMDHIEELYETAFVDLFLKILGSNREELIKNLLSTLFNGEDPLGDFVQDLNDSYSLGILIPPSSSFRDAVDIILTALDENSEDLVTILITDYIADLDPDLETENISNFLLPIDIEACLF